jgi:hypothetical protein
MRRADLEHAIRAATQIIAADQIIVIGSQSILGSYGEDELPPEATMSIEVDMAPLNDDDAGALATRIDGAIGELSLFHETYGFYVQGVGRETATLPAGWEDRLVAVQGANTNGRTGLCLDPHDLCIAKLAAAREKDFRFVGALLDAGFVQLDVLNQRARLLPNMNDRTRVSIENWINTARQVTHIQPPDHGLGL